MRAPSFVCPYGYAARRYGLVNVAHSFPQPIELRHGPIGDLVQSSKPRLTSRALQRPLVSGGVVNRSVVGNKKHRKSLSCNATTIGAEQHSCLARKPLETFGTIRAKGGER